MKVIKKDLDLKIKYNNCLVIVCISLCLYSQLIYQCFGYFQRVEFLLIYFVDVTVYLRNKQFLKFE